TGKVEAVNLPLLTQFIGAGRVPVIAPLALSTEQQALNVDGDRVAAAIAVAIDADALIILTSVPGLLRDADDPRTLVAETTIAEQARTLASCTELFYNDRRAALYDVLARILPAALDRVFLCNSGTEAVEGALKFARAATKRTGIVATMRGFHGKTMGALSATWGPEYRDMFGPLVPGFSHVPFNKPEALDAAITDETAAFIFELVQG